MSTDDLAYWNSRRRALLAEVAVIDRLLAEHAPARALTEGQRAAEAVRRRERERVGPQETKEVAPGNGRE